jgi:hypothetical protein
MRPDNGKSTVGSRLKALIWTSGAWLGLVCAYAAYYVHAHTGLPGAEGYEAQWDWQLFFFALVRMPLLVLLLVAVLFVQWRLLARRRPQGDSGDG